MIANALPRPLTAGSVDNAILRADGTGGSTLQSSGLLVEDAIVSFAVTGDAATDIITATGHNLVADQPVRFTALTGGSGLLTTTNYFVRDISGSTFKVSTTSGGAAVNFTTAITAGTLLTGHSVSTNVTLSENTTATNSDLVLTPKGTGALIAGQKPDGTVVGGNARGSKSICLVGDRSAATQVASGSNSVSIGHRSTASADRAISIGGTASGTLAIAIGNSIASGATDSSIAIGLNNISSGSYGCISMGTSSSASGSASVSVGRFVNSTAAYANAFGLHALSNRMGMVAYSAGQFAAGDTPTGDAQRARFVLRCKTTTNAAVELFLDGSSTRLTIPSGKIFAFTINISGVKSDGSAVAHYLRQYCLKNVTGTTSQVYAPVTIGTDNAAGTTIALSANDTNDALKVEVTGITSEIWRWVASVDAVEVAYGI